MKAGNCAALRCVQMGGLSYEAGLKSGALITLLNANKNGPFCFQKRPPNVFSLELTSYHRRLKGYPEAYRRLSLHRRRS